MSIHSLPRSILSLHSFSLMWLKLPLFRLVWKRLLSTLLATWMMAGHAEPAPPHIAAELTQARPSGAGTFRYFGMHIYDAQFWVGANGYRIEAPTSEKFALDLRYARALSGKRIASSSADEIKKLGLGNPEQRARWEYRMAEIFPDVREGTHITGIYIPNKGALFFLDGKPLGEVLDPEFAFAFFSIWLSPKTTDDRLRQALLAEAAPR